MKKIAFSSLIILILIIFFSLSLSAASRRGKRALSDGNFDRALSIFIKDVGKNANNWEAHSLIGYIYFQEGYEDIDKAVSHLQKAFGINQSDPLTNIYLFIGYIRKGNYSSAQDMLSFISEKDVEKVNDNYLFYLHKGILLFNQNQHDEAIAELIKSVELYPACGICRKQLGMVYYALNDYLQAEAVLSRAVGFLPDDYAVNSALADIFLQEGHLNPGSALLHINKLKSISQANDIKVLLLDGRYHRMRENYRQALSLYSQAYSIDSGDCEVNIALADIYQKNETQNLSLSKKHLNYVQENCKDYDGIHILLANYYYNTGNFQKAISEYETHIGDNPEDIIAMVQLALVYLQRQVNKPSKAIETGLEALKINQTYLPAIRIVSIGYFFSNDYKKAKEYIERAVRISPNDGEMHAYLSEIYLTEKNYRLAKHHGEKAVSVAPNEIRALRVLGETAYIEKDYKRAISYFENVIRLKKDDYRSCLLLSYLYQEDGFTDYRKSYHYAEMALRTNPSDSNTWKILGNAYLNDRMLSKALDAFENSLKYNPSDAWVRAQVIDLKRRLGKE